jgi:hypothetical protein
VLLNPVSTTSQLSFILEGLAQMTTFGFRLLPVLAVFLFPKYLSMIVFSEDTCLLISLWFGFKALMVPHHLDQLCPNGLL